MKLPLLLLKLTFYTFHQMVREDSLGNMDVYASEAFENTVSEPLHLDSPINSINDDIGYIVNTDNKGYFSFESLARPRK